MIDNKAIQKYIKRSVPWLLKLATQHFNEYIRNRDSDGSFFVCISCGKQKSKDMMHCGHYLSAGHHASVRFSEENCNGQCSACNTHLHGNLINYRGGLIKKIGADRVEYLEAISKRPKKWDKIELIEIIVSYKAKLKEQK